MGRQDDWCDAARTFVFIPLSPLNSALRSALLYMLLCSASSSSFCFPYRSMFFCSFIHSPNHAVHPAPSSVLAVHLLFVLLLQFTLLYTSMSNNTTDRPLPTPPPPPTLTDYTVAGGKMNRGLSVVSVIKTLSGAKGKTLTIKERCQAVALGWCIEFLQAFFLVADDIMDDSITRRGNICWFRKKEIKLIAINDSFLLESCVYKILKKYFGNEVSDSCTLLWCGVVWRVVCGDV